jgi:hypothetical protein
VNNGRHTCLGYTRSNTFLITPSSYFVTYIMQWWWDAHSYIHSTNPIAIGCSLIVPLRRWKYIHWNNSKIKWQINCFVSSAVSFCDKLELENHIILCLSCENKTNLMKSCLAWELVWGVAGSARGWFAFLGACLLTNWQTSRSYWRQFLFSIRTRI